MSTNLIYAYSPLGDKLEYTDVRSYYLQFGFNSVLVTSILRAKERGSESCMVARGRG